MNEENIEVTFCSSTRAQCLFGIPCGLFTPLFWERVTERAEKLSRDKISRDFLSLY